MKAYADTRSKAKPSKIKIGDLVLVYQRKRNKLSTRFNPSPFRVTGKRGTMITAHRKGKYITRNASHFKLVDPTLQDVTDNEEPDMDNEELISDEQDRPPGSQASMRNLRRSQLERKTFKQFGQNIYEQ